MKTKLLEVNDEFGKSYAVYAELNPCSTPIDHYELCIVSETLTDGIVEQTDKKLNLFLNKKSLTELTTLLRNI